MDYAEFIAGKRAIVAPAGIEGHVELNPRLFAFQAPVVRWALSRGRSAIWADCGLGKGWMAIEWARIVSEHTGAPVLILTPLAVAQQFVGEGQKLGVRVTHVREREDVRAGVNVTNYERLQRLESGVFGGVVCDESSILKDFTSVTRNELIATFAQTPFRLACTATPAPNDFMELGNHAEFLGIMSRTEMLSMFFVHDGGSTQDWRLKGHAQREFWRWVSSWAVAFRSPADLGFSADGFALPPLNVVEHVVPIGAEFARDRGTLFTTEVHGLDDQRKARRASLGPRVEKAAEIVNGEPDEPWIVWCDLNDEAARLTSAIPGAVEIRGSDKPDDKEQKMADFSSGAIRVLVTKPSIAGWGLNWQHCARTVFVGLSNSFEAWYQAIRRTYRFGQRRQVDCHLVTSDAEGAVAANLRRKQGDAERMVASIVAEMQGFSAVAAAGRDQTDYRPTVPMTVPDWLGREDGP